MINIDNCNQIKKKVKNSFKKKYLLFNHVPTLAYKDQLFLKKCLESECIFSIDRYVNNFKEEIKSFTGAKHAISTVNGTYTTHIALKVLNVNQNDEVIVTSLSFVVLANAVRY